MSPTEYYERMIDKYLETAAIKLIIKSPVGILYSLPRTIMVVIQMMHWLLKLKEVLHFFVRISLYKTSICSL